MTENLDAKIHKVAVDSAYQEAALSGIRDMVKGNNIDPASVKLNSFEGEILNFQAEMLINVSYSSTKKSAGGKAQGHFAVESESAAQDLMKGEYYAMRGDAGLIDRIIKILTGMPAHGFAKSDMKLALPFWRKSFVVHYGCTSCNKAGKIKCTRCNGSGTYNCPKCFGNGMSSCNTCNGSRTVVDHNRGRIPCYTCNGIGKVSCAGCRQTGRITCMGCGGRCQIQCSKCTGSGWMSMIHDMYIEGMTKFNYPKERLPARVVQLIEKLKDKLAHHAQIRVAPYQPSLMNAQNPNIQTKDKNADDDNALQIAVLYDVILPYSNLSFDIGSKSYYAFLFGTKGIVDHSSPFLDEALSEPLRKLNDISENRGSPIDALKMVASYRTSREALLLVIQHAQSKATKELLKNNYIGLSYETAKKLIQLADSAINKVTHKMRTAGLVVGVIATTATMITYFLSPLRIAFLNILSPVIPSVLIDFGFIFVAVYLGLLTIQATIGESIKSLYQRIMPKNPPRQPNTKLGKQIYTHIACSVTALGGILEGGRQNGFKVPEWYLDCLGFILHSLS